MNDTEKLSSEMIKIDTNDDLNEDNKITEKKINSNNEEITQKSNIKIKVILFALIVVGIVIVAIIILLILKNKNSNNDKNDNDHTIDDNIPTFDDVICINNRRIFNFSEIRNSSIDIYNNIKNVECSEIYCFCSYLEGISSNMSNEVKVYLTYKWVAENIEYDYEKYISGEPVECEVDKVYENKKTVSSGYAKLFTKLLQCFNYNDDIHNIQGHSKELNYNVETIIIDSDTNHEWNVVKLYEEWCLIDTTWGAGSIINGQYKKEYNEYYLCTPPEQFVRKNLPQESEKYFQILNNPIHLDTFQNLTPTQRYFFEYGFVGLAYDKTIQNICGKGRIILKFDEEQNPLPSLIVSLKKENENVKKTYWIYFKKTNTNYFYIDFYINEQGNYDLQIDCQNTLSSPYTLIVSFKIKCDSSPKEEHTFPTFYDLYNNDENIELIYPIYQNLEKGKTYNFKVWAPEKNELYLKLMGSTGTLETIPMEKEGEYFIKNDIMIYTGNIWIQSTPSSGTYIRYQSK